MGDKSVEWLAPKQLKLPDFIINGAMKSGTSTLHAILNQHPDVFIPKKELHFFDMDNIVQHPNFNVFKQSKWSHPDLAKNPQDYWQWYSSNFKDAGANQLIGEDSTTYLASPSAAKRIAMQHKQIKLIVMLRQPTARVYSHYWHMVKAGRAMFNFEDTLRLYPHSLLMRSDYLTQLKSLFTYIPKEQVKVILFEDFLENKIAVVKDTCNFLNIDFDKLPEKAIDLHENHSRIPKFVTLDLLKSRFFNYRFTNANAEHFTNVKNSKTNRFTLLFSRLYRLVNPLVLKKPKAINPSTKVFLDEYFYRELQGIDELLSQNIMSKWFRKNKRK